jgi:hypothetical protein
MLSAAFGGNPGVPAGSPPFRTSYSSSRTNIRILDAPAHAALGPTLELVPETNRAFGDDAHVPSASPARRRCKGSCPLVSVSTSSPRHH